MVQCAASIGALWAAMSIQTVERQI